MSKLILKTKWKEEEARKQVLIRFTKINNEYSIDKKNSHTDYYVLENSLKEYKNYKIKECICKIKTKDEGNVSSYLSAILPSPDLSFVGFLRFTKKVGVNFFQTRQDMLMGDSKYVFISKTFTAESDLEHNVGYKAYIGGEYSYKKGSGEKVMKLRGYDKVDIIKPEYGNLTVFSGCDEPVLPNPMDEHIEHGASHVKHPIEEFNPSEKSSLAVAPLGTCMEGISPNYNEVNFKGSGKIEGYLIEFDGAAKYYQPTLEKIIEELCMGKNKCNEEEIYVLEPDKKRKIKLKLSNTLKRKSDADKLEILKKYEKQYGYEIVKGELVTLLRNPLINELSRKNPEVQQKIVNNYKEKYGVDTVKNIHESLLTQYGKKNKPDHYLHTLDFKSEPTSTNSKNEPKRKRDDDEEGSSLKKIKPDDNSSKRKINVEDPSRNGKGKRKRNE